MEDLAVQLLDALPRPVEVGLGLLPKLVKAEGHEGAERADQGS